MAYLCLVRAGYQWDYVFDWTILKHQQSGTVPRPPAAPRPEAVAGEGEEQQDPNYGRYASAEYGWGRTQ